MLKGIWNQAQYICEMEYSHHFESSHSGVISSKRNHFTGIVSDVTWPRLADNEGSITLHCDPGTAGWIYDNTVLLPNIPEYYSASVNHYKNFKTD